MSSADLLEDGFPHGTPAGYRAGCHSGGLCTNRGTARMTCKEANTRYAADRRYRTLIDAGVAWVVPGDVTPEALAAAAAPAVPKPKPRPSKRRDAFAGDDELRARLAAPDFPHGTVEGFARGCVVTAMCHADANGRTCVQARQEQLSDHDRRRRGASPDPAAPKETTMTVVDENAAHTFELASSAAFDEADGDSAAGGAAVEKTAVGAALEDALHDKMSHDERWRHYNKGCRHPLCKAAIARRQRERKELLAAEAAAPTKTVREPAVIEAVEATENTAELLQLALADVARLEQDRADHIEEIEQLQAAVRLREKTIEQLQANPPAIDVKPLTAATDALAGALHTLHTLPSRRDLAVVPETVTAEQVRAACIALGIDYDQHRTYSIEINPASLSLTVEHEPDELLGGDRRLYADYAYSWTTDGHRIDLGISTAPPGTAVVPAGAEPTGVALTLTSEEAAAVIHALATSRP
jgi:hypothetical protein